ncbi:MAG: hypothetical protein KAQ94_00410 [Arcobacteraceae bacterium]|nr:hypothetical protein [Arcobacteraceae bacterium]
MKIYFLSIGLIILLFTGCTKSIEVPQAELEKQIPEVSKKTSVIVEKIPLKSDDNITTISSDIAIVFSSKVIGNYAINATNSAMSYLIYKNQNFNLKVFDVANEDINSIQSIFEQISNNGISKVLVLFTHNGASNLKQIKDIDSYDIYLPLIYKDDLNLNIDSVVYGSIDYSKQCEEILKYSNIKLVEFHDNSKLGTRLAKIINTKDINLIYQKEIDDENAEYSRFLSRKKGQLTNSTLIVNMPIVKTSIILSQINANEINLNKILSTQLNYTPLLLSLTQVGDRRDMIIANSIGKTNKTIEEYNAILGNDLVYNWVNYSTTIGIEYLISKDVSSFENIKLNKNQIEYPVTLFSTTKYAFKTIF